MVQKIQLGIRSADPILCVHQTRKRNHSTSQEHSPVAPNGAEEPAKFSHDTQPTPPVARASNRLSPTFNMMPQYKT